MRSFLAVILGVVLFSSAGLAQEDHFTAATSALQGVVFSLKKSIEKLTLDNDQLEARDNAIKEQVLELQTQLQVLEGRGGILNMKASRLQEKNPRRQQQILKLENEISALIEHTQKTKEDIQSLQQSSSQGSQAAAIHEKEKLRLMKMIYESQQRQEALQKSIMERSGPKEQASGIQENRNFWSDAQLRQLAWQLMVLEKNYAQLKVLTERMSKKAQSARMTDSQRMEGEKIQKKMEDLDHQSLGLNAQLDDLRSQMVELDKRKAYLETMTQQSP